MFRCKLTYWALALFCCLMVPISMMAETRQLAVSIGFPVNKTDIRPDFGDNAAQLAALVAFLSKINPDSIETISIDGYASPEGQFGNNMRLARGRAKALMGYIAELTSIPAEKLEVGESLLSWEALKPLVEQSNMKDADAVLALINVAIADHSDAAQQDVLSRLQSLNGGSVWQELKRDYFPQLRLSKLIVKAK